MAERPSTRADELQPGAHVYIHNDRNWLVRKVASTLTVAGRTTVVYDDGEPIRVAAGERFLTPTDGEIAEHEHSRDREAVAAALRALGNRILEQSLPVPPGGRGVVVSFDLADDADLEPWSRFLGVSPSRPDRRPMLLGESGGLTVQAYGPADAVGDGTALAPYDPNPAIGMTVATAAEIAAAYGRIAADYDERCPGWHNDDLRPMAPGLADEALKRRRASGIERQDAVGAFPVARRYDDNPTVDARDPEAYAHYAKRLDAEVPGWWKDDTSRMALGLAVEARKRSALDAGWSLAGHAHQASDALQQDRFENEETQP